MFDLSPLGTQVQQQVWTANTVTAEWVLLCLSQHFLGSSNCSLSPSLSTVGSAGSGKGQLQIPSGMLVLMAKSVVNFGLNSTVINFFFLNCVLLIQVRLLLCYLESWCAVCAQPWVVSLWLAYLRVMWCLLTVYLSDFFFPDYIQKGGKMLIITVIIKTQVTVR